DNRLYLWINKVVLQELKAFTCGCAIVIQGNQCSFLIRETNAIICEILNDIQKLWGSIHHLCLKCCIDALDLKLLLIIVERYLSKTSDLRILRAILINHVLTSC